MSEPVIAEYTASWECPKCEEYVDSNEYELEDAITHIKCGEMVVNSDGDFEECGHEYSVRQY